MSTWRCVALSGGVALVCGEAWQDLLWRDLLWQCGRHGSRCLLRGPFFLFFSFLFFPPPALTPFGIQGPSSGSTKFTGPSCGHPNQPTYERAFEDSMLWADRCTFSGEPGSNGMASTLPEPRSHRQLCSYLHSIYLLPRYAFPRGSRLQSHCTSTHYRVLASPFPKTMDMTSSGSSHAIPWMDSIPEHVRGQTVLAQELAVAKNNTNSGYSGFFGCNSVDQQTHCPRITPAVPAAGERKKQQATTTHRQPLTRHSFV